MRRASPARKRQPRQRPETRASRRTLLAEINRARSLGVNLLNERAFPTLCRLLVTGEHFASTRPKVRTFRFEGSEYRWATTNLGRLIVSFPDGRGIVGSGPGLVGASDDQGAMDR